MHGTTRPFSVYIIPLYIFLIIILSGLQLSNLQPFGNYSEHDTGQYNSDLIIEPEDNDNIPHLDSISSNPELPKVPSGTKANGDDEVDETTYSDNWIEATYEVMFQEPALINIDAHFKIHEVDLEMIYGPVTAAELRTLSGGKEDSTIITYLKSHVEKEIFSKFLELTFPGGDYNYQSSVVDESTLKAPANGEIYHPAVEVTLNGYVILHESSFFTESESEDYDIKNLDDLIEGSLKMGAKISMTLKLAAKMGHKIEFRFAVPFYSNYQHPEQLKITHPSDEDKKSDYLVVKTIDNKDGNHSKIEYLTDLSIKVVTPTPELGTGAREDIKIQFEMDIADFHVIYLHPSLIEVAIFDIGDSTINLPENISELTHISSDGIRLFYDNGIITEEDIQDNINKELNKTSGSLHQRLNTSSPIKLDLEWDLASIENLVPLYNLDDTDIYNRMGSERPIRGYVQAQDAIEPHLFETKLENDTIFGFLNAGAQAELNIRISTKYDYNINLILPEGLRLKGRIGTPGMRDSYLISEYDADDIILVSKKAPEYATNNANLDIKVDINEIDMINFNQFESEVQITVVGVLHHILSTAHSGFNAILPERITMKYVNSDAFRLAYSKNLLDLNEITDEIYNIIEANLTRIFEGNIDPNVQFEDKSIAFDGNIDRMDDELPIKFTITAEGKMEIGQGSSDSLEDTMTYNGCNVQGHGISNSIVDTDNIKLAAFISHDLVIPLVGMHGWNATYRIILPKYIEIIGTPKLENITGITTEVVTGVADEGRHYLQVTIYSDDPEVKHLEAVIKIKINITPWFFLSKSIIPLILSCILLISLIYIYILRTRKSKILKEEVQEMGKSIKDFDKSRFVRVKRKHKAKFLSGFGNIDSSDREPSIDEGFGPEQAQEPMDLDYIATISESQYPLKETKTDYRGMVREMVPKHKGKLESKGKKDGGRHHRKVKVTRSKNKKKYKTKSMLSIMVILILLLSIMPLTANSQVDEDHISSPANIPIFEFTAAPSISPGEITELNFVIINRYSFEITNVFLTLNIFKYVTLETSKDVEGLKYSPKIIQASGGMEYSISEGQTIVFQWPLLGNDTASPLHIEISTSKNTLQGRYFVRMNLTFEYEGNTYIMKSRGYYTQKEWDVADITSKTDSPGDINLTALGVHGIIPDTSFRVKAPIPLWPLILIVGLCIFCAILAGVFYLMDEHGKFPNAKKKLDKFGKRFRKKKR